jgi:hypothetical protein
MTRGKQTMKARSIRFVIVLAGLLLLMPHVVTAGDDPVELGVVHFERADVERTLQSSGEAVTSGGVVRTEMVLAVVHLDNGQVFKLDPNSAARFESLPFGEVQVTVFSGRLTKWSASGKPLTAGAGSRFVAGPSSADPMALEQALLQPDAPRKLGR